jgi:hypothetical protein
MTPTTCQRGDAAMSAACDGGGVVMRVMPVMEELSVMAAVLS